MRVCTFIGVLLLTTASWAQEVVNPLYKNVQLPEHQHKLAASTLSLPFFDDFSTYKGHPDPARWMDADAFVNTTYPLNPLNLGVATLDGLDAQGNPYNILTQNAHGDADYLTSQFIDLSTYGTVYLTFAYQAGGMGNTPESNDPISLELKDSSGSWQEVWSENGGAVQPFQELSITIDQAKYLHDDFQFRFHNEATLSGSFDHWHIDNVLLTDDLSLSTDREDVAFVYETARLLTDYHTVPWSHYLVDPTAVMASTMDSWLRNNYQGMESVDYRYDIFDEGSAQIFHYPYDPVASQRNDNIEAYSNIGNFSYTDDSPEAITLNNSSTFSDNGASYASFELVQSIATDDADHFKQNDTLRTWQHFHNYYALDDGTAEASYGVNVAGGKVAMRFNLAKKDTLKAVQLHFEQQLQDASGVPYKLCIWDNDGGQPGDTLFTSEVLYPTYGNATNAFVTYVMPRDIALQGNIFIGWEQFNADIINIGLDKNTLNNDRMFYNIGSGWANSSCAGCEGSWMIRPVFGSLTVSAVAEQEVSGVNIYPLPAKDWVYLSAQEAVSYKLYSLDARLLKEELKEAREHRMDVSELAAGIYIIELRSKANVYKTKLMVQ
jgi:hypothetical protein